MHYLMHITVCGKAVSLLLQMNAIMLQSEWLIYDADTCLYARQLNILVLCCGQPWRCSASMYFYTSTKSTLAIRSHRIRYDAAPIVSKTSTVGTECELQSVCMGVTYECFRNPIF